MSAIYKDSSEIVPNSRMFEVPAPGLLNDLAKAPIFVYWLRLNWERNFNLHRASSTDGRSEVTSREDIFLIAMCGLMSLIDGFDAQAIAYAAPLLSDEFAASPSVIGSMFSIGLFGGLVGAVPAIHLDKLVGRRRLMMICLLWFAVGSAVTAMVTSAPVMLIVRFLSGVGLGMAIPLLMGTMTDSVPTRIRARALAVITCAIPAGALLGGLIAAAVLPTMGWRILFVIGAVAPVVLMLPFNMALRNVEHRFSALRSGGVDTVGATVRFVGQMFRFGGIGLVLLLLTNFCSMLLTFSLMSWTPSLLVQSGADNSFASLAGGILNGGAMIATLTLGFVLDRYDAERTALICYGLAMLSLLVMAAAGGAGAATLGIVVIAGFFGIGSQICLNYMIAHSVRAEQRVAIIGIAMIASRMGGTVGPMLFGLLIQIGWTPPAMFAFAASIALVVIAGIYVSNRTIRRPDDGPPHGAVPG